MKNTLLLLVLLLWKTNMGFAQTQQPNEIIVQTNNPRSILSLVEALQKANNTPATYQELCTEINVFLIQLADNQSFEKSLHFLNESPLVRNVQRNRRIERAEDRCTISPNDSLFSRQLSLPLINVDELWCKTKGGLSTTSDSIVMGIMEPGGYDFRHADLLPNIWRNIAEIPDNNIDDDKNGYVDDYFGLNTLNNTDNHPVTRHGTGVAGIMGAKMDNVKGIAGISPNSKMMLVSNASLESQWISGLAYFLKMRKLYNESNGKKGAFVVVVNTSAGFSDKRAKDFPILCQMYDELGKVGILNVNATDNRNVDIDVVGDIPADCASNYLVVVANSTNRDEKVDNSAFGKKLVDLFAPGDDILTTDLYNGYMDGFTGCSASSPHVAAGIALLYALPVSGWMDDVKAKPAESALKMKDFILNGAKKSTNLNNLALTGGRLDLAQSMKLMEEAYSPIAAITLNKIYPNPVPFGKDLTIQYNTNLYSVHTLEVFNVLGQIVTQTDINPIGLINNEFLLNVDNYAQGVYIARFANANNSKVFKFIVRR